MKKNLIVCLSLIFLMALSGCAKKTNTDFSAEGIKTLDFEENAEEVPTKSFTGNSIEDTEGKCAENTGEVSGLNKNLSNNVISSNMLSSALYNALQKEWNAWNDMDKFQQMVSSHLPGHIYKQFNTWAECEKFIGFELFNPLENSEFEKGSYVGMPLGFNDASRFYISLYGESPEKVNWIHLQSGYRDGEVRITINLQISSDISEKAQDVPAPLITEDSGEEYVAVETVLVRGSLAYNIRVIGSKNQWQEVRETMKKVLPYFVTVESEDFPNPTNVPTSAPEEIFSPANSPKPIEFPNPTESLKITEVPEDSETVVKNKSLLDFLKIAMQPVGKVMYVYGGGWNEEDTGAGIEAVTIGISPVWEAYAAKQKETYNYKETRYQIHDGLDCSSYVGWAIYNVMETENGKDGYVFSASKMSEKLSELGLGEYISAKKTKKMSDWRAGDIASMEDSGHVWIVVGTCEDGSVLLLHCSPPGVFFCGIKLQDGSKSIAVSLAEEIMETYYPDWYKRFPKCYRSYSYLTKTSVMRWSREVLSDEEGLTGMSAEEIVSVLFDQKQE